MDRKEMRELDKLMSKRARKKDRLEVGETVELVNDVKGTRTDVEVLGFDGFRVKFKYLEGNRKGETDELGILSIDKK